MADRDDLGLFQGYGIEIEYMLVDADSLDICPRADALLAAAGGPGTSQVERETVSWSNELVNHVIELKTSGPQPALAGLDTAFHAELSAVRGIADTLGATVLPGAMHTWFRPEDGYALFPHGERETYQAFDRIFGCGHHGFSNLQSMHINLPFQGDEEFGRLHAAVRAVLPLLPGLAAASPIIESRRAPHADQRLAVYASNCARIPSVTGQIIPEPVYSIAEYRTLLGGLYADIAPHDPDGLLQEEWLNARGAIARFDRNCIEIRVIDAQECPRADLAIAELTRAVLQALCEERWASQAALRALDTGLLARELWRAIRDAEQATVGEAGWLRLLGCGDGEATLATIWAGLTEQLAGDLSPGAQSAIEHILRHGTLASRMTRGLDSSGDGAIHRTALQALGRSSIEALAENRQLTP